MDQDRFVGTAKDMAGKVQGAVGDLVGDTKTQAEGRLREAEGTVQNLVGQAKDSVRQAADQASEAASQAADRGRQYLDQGRQYFEETRQRYPEAERYYRDGSEMVRGQVQDSPLIAIAIAGAVGYLLAVLIHARR